MPVYILYWKPPICVLSTRGLLHLFIYLFIYLGGGGGNDILLAYLFMCFNVGIYYL